MSTYSNVIGIRGAALARAARPLSPVRLLVPNLAAAVFAVALIQVLFLSHGTTALFNDSDAGWHIRNGEMILATRSVPRVDSFSYTRPGEAWIAWEWLSDVLFGGVHRLAGPAGVAFVAALLIALTAWGATRLALALSGDLLATAVASALLLGTTSMHWLARPHIFSWLFALAFVAVAEQERRVSSKLLFTLPALACIWANAHASFVLGPAVLALYAMGEFLGFAERHGLKAFQSLFKVENSALRRFRRFAVAALSTLAATLVNPYSWRLHEHVISYLRNSYLMDHISEFHSFNFHQAGAIYVELFLAAAMLGTIALFHQRAYGPALLAVALLHLSLYSARHLPTAAVLLLPLSTAALVTETRRWPRLRPVLEYSRRLRAIDLRVGGLVPAALVVFVIISVLTPLARAGRVGFDPSKFPTQAADYLAQHARTASGYARVFAKDQWSSYLIYRFDGRMKVFLDGRSDFYGTEMVKNYSGIVNLQPDWDDALAGYGVQFTLVAPDDALASALALSPIWHRVYSDAVAIVFERVR